jgi:small-conductance mechanosensitive channel
MPDLVPLLQKALVTLPAALAILVGAAGLNLLLGRGLRLLADKTSFDEQDLTPFSKVGRWLINGAALVMLLGALGFNLGGLWAMLATVVGMVAIGFVAVWSVLSNTLCTLIILIYRPFDIGDEIEFAGEPVQGKVADLNFIFTTLRASDGTFLQIPNNLFLQKVIKRRRSASAIPLADRSSAGHSLGLR